MVAKPESPLSRFNEFAEATPPKYLTSWEDVMAERDRHIAAYFELVFGMTMKEFIRRHGKEEKDGS